MMLLIHCATEELTSACVGSSRLVHTEKRMNASYYISRVDPCMYLVLLLEGKRRPNEKTTQVSFLVCEEQIELSRLTDASHRSFRTSCKH